MNALDKLIIFTRGGDLDKIALDAAEELAQLRKTVDEARDVMQRIEYSVDAENLCPYCYYRKHVSTCILGNWLAANKEDK